MTQLLKVYRAGGSTEDYEPTSLKWNVDKDGVAVVQFSDMKTRNALTQNFMMELFLALEHAERCPDVKVVIWTGTGPSWTSGMSLKKPEPPKLSKDVIEEYRQRKMAPEKTDTVLRNITHAFWRFPKISIAAVNGYAVGGGANMVLCNQHDYVLCSESARFKYPFTSLGITPELGSSRVLPAIIGYAKAKELLMLGEWFGAREALGMNLVNRVVPDADLMKEAMAVARKYLALDQKVLGRAKRLINHWGQKDLDTVLNKEMEYMEYAQDAMARAQRTRAKM